MSIWITSATMYARVMERVTPKDVKLYDLLIILTIIYSKLEKVLVYQANTFFDC